MYSGKYEIIAAAKTLLGTCGDDAVLELIVDDTVAAVLAYCRIDVLPYQLYGLVAQMAAKSYKANGYGTEETAPEVASLSVGDRSVSYRESPSGILTDFEARLKPFVNRKCYAPSEVIGHD